MTAALGLSLGSALALGLSTILFAVAARRSGTAVAATATLVLAYLPMLGVAIVLADRLVLPARTTLEVAVAGALVTVAYLAAIESLRRGPISITGPIAAANGAAIVVAAFVLVGERPTAGQWLGVAVTAAGVVLACVTRQGSSADRVGSGPLFALAGIACGAVASVIVRDPIREHDPVGVAVAQRSFTILALAPVLVWVGLRLRAGRPVAADALPDRRSRVVDRRLLALLLALGALDAIAFIGFAHAVNAAPAWFVGLVSQSGRALAIVGGVLLFHERLQGQQWAGVATLVAGLGILGVTTRSIEL